MHVEVPAAFFAMFSRFGGDSVAILGSGGPNSSQDWESVDLLQGSFGPFEPKAGQKESESELLRPLGPGVEKVKNGVEKESKSGETRGPGSLGGPGSWYSHAGSLGGPGSWYSHAKPLTVRESHEPGPPLEPGPLAPCPFPKRCRKGGGGGSRPEGGGPGSKGGRGTGSWCSSACTAPRSVGVPRAGSPQRAGTPCIFPQNRQFFLLLGLFFDSVFDLCGRGAERLPELIFGLFFQLWARRAQMTPVADKHFRNLRRLFETFPCCGLCRWRARSQC